MRDVLEILRDADPAVAEPDWGSTGEAVALLRRVLVEAPASNAAPAGGPPRRWGPVVLVAAALLIVGGGIAAATGWLFGQPAPDSVRTDIAGVDQGMPADLRLNPDVANARLVAVAGDAKLYYASLKDGGYCFEIVTASAEGRGAVCTPAAKIQADSIEVTSPFVDPVTSGSRILVGGRVNVTSVDGLVARFASGAEAAIPLGDDRFYLFDVPEAERASVHASGMTLIARQAGTTIATAQLPPTDFSNPEEMDRLQPIFVSTISTSSDFTKVLGVEGSVNIAGAKTLELQYPDGTVVPVPIQAGGTYRYMIPADRQDDLFHQPGWLVARDAGGAEVGRAPVAAVAYWHSR